VAQVVLDCAGIVTVIRQLVACAMSQHMRMYRERIDKLTYRRGLVLLDGECNALNVGANPHSEHDLKSKDA
jgi:hypothetical protein